MSHDTSEIIYGTNGRDVIRGYGGDDEIYGYGGDDDLYGDSGDDYLSGGSGADDLIGGTGVNDYLGGTGSDRFIMSARGSSGFSDDAVIDFFPDTDGDKIDVSAWGVSDFSQVQALLFNNEFGDATLNAYYFGYDHLLAIEGFSAAELQSSDFVFSNAGGSTKNGTSYGDVLFGSDFADMLNGNAGFDTLLGGTGGDRLNGSSGDDDLIGGAGRDILNGGSGRDFFVFETASESPPGAGRDTIQDFQLGLDAIDLERIDASAASGDQDFTFREMAPLTGAGQLRYFYSGGNTIVQGSTDNDAAAEFEIELIGRYNLDASDFDL